MQALVFTESLRDIQKELKIGDLITLLESLFSTPSNQAISEDVKTRFSALIFSSHAGYEKLMENQDTRKILELMEVRRFYDPNVLTRMIAGISSAASIQQLQSGAGFGAFNAFLELLRSFRRVVATSEVLLERDKIGELPSTDDVFEIELVEYSDEAGISPQRVNSFLKEIVELHAALTRIYGIPSDALKIKYLDSGSNFVWGLQCAKPVAQAINTLLSQWLDKFRFWKIDTFERRMEAMSKGLDVAEKIHDAVEKRVIDKETADNLRIRIFHNVENLFGIGATVPLRGNATVDQKQLMTEIRNTKLLASGIPERQSGDEASPPSVGPTSANNAQPGTH